MFVLFMLAFFVSFFAMIIGLIKPELVLFNCKNKTRLRAFSVYFFLFIVFIFLTDIFAPKEGESVSPVWPIITLGGIFFCWWCYKKSKTGGPKIWTNSKQVIQSLPKDEPPIANTGTEWNPASPLSNFTSIKKDNRIRRSTRVRFQYTDSFGSLTERNLQLYNVTKEHGLLYLRGFCELRKQERTFQSDRIIGDVINLNTGEPLYPEDLVAMFPPDPASTLRIGTAAKKTTNRSSTGQQPVTAPSGFEFPFFPFDEITLVRIKDRTNYRQDFLGNCYDRHERETYDTERFEHDLAPYMLDIEIDDFMTMFKPKALSKLGLEKLPRGFGEFYEEVLNKTDDGEPLEWFITNPIHKQLIKNGMMEQFEMERSEGNILSYLSNLTVPELKEECGRLGLKKTQNKAGLTESLMGEKDQLIIAHKGKLLPQYYETIDQLGAAYIENIETQLSDKPDDYAAVIWEQVADEYDTGRGLPHSAIMRAKAESDRYSHLFDNP